MRVAETKVYQFSELSTEAQNKAIKQERERKYQCDYILDMFHDDATEQIKETGFEDIKLQYSLSHSQGDGLCFSARRYTKLEDLFNKVLGTGKKKTSKLLADNCTQIFKGNEGRYCYAQKQQVDLYLENYTSTVNTPVRIDEVISKVLNELEDIYMELCSKLQTQGYDELEYLFSDKCIKEDIEANDYEFTENGKRY